MEVEDDAIVVRAGVGRIVKLSVPLEYGLVL